MTIQFDVLGIGNILMDIIAPVSNDFLKKEEIEKASMSLIGEERATILTNSFLSHGKVQEIAGGSAANTLFGINALGLRSAFIGKVKNDKIGNRIKKSMIEGGVDFFSSLNMSGPASGRCLIAVTPDGERSMSTFLGAACMFTKKDIIKSKIKAASCVYLEGYLFDTPPAKEAFIQVAKIAKSYDRKIALTLSDSFCVDRHRSSFQSFINDHVNILFANKDEILSLYKCEDIETALNNLSSKKLTACITDGKSGSLIQSGTSRHYINASPVKDVVDTTGAGDQYAAGVLAGRALGLDWPDSGYLGSIAASEVVSHYGARPLSNINEGLNQFIPNY